MTVSSAANRLQYTGNASTTAFTAPALLDQSHIEVYLDGVLQTITTHYTVSGVGGASATVTFVSAPGSGVVVTLARAVPLSQTEDYVENDPFPAETHERALDKLTMIEQQQQDELDRALKFAVTVSTSLVPLLSEVPVDGYGLVWDGTSGTIRNTTSTLASLEGDAETVADSIASVNTVAADLDGADNIGTVADDLNGSDTIGTVAGAITNVNLVGGSISNVNTVAGSITNVNTVATNIANVNTVGGISSDVTTVADNDANVTIVATDLDGDDDVGTVAAAITNVNLVGGSIADVNTVAASDTEIGVVATDLSGSDTIGTVAGSIADVNAVGGSIADVSAVATDLSGSDNIGTVAGAITNVNLVGGSIADVNTVAGIDTEVTAVAGNATNINTVAGIDTEITTVAGDSADIQSLAPVSSDIQTLADIEDGTVSTDAISDLAAIASDVTTAASNSANITAVAGIDTEITTVAGDSSDINTVAGISSGITAVAADAADIGVVATDLSGSDTIGAVASISSDVTAVAAIAADISQVADEIVAALRWTYSSTTTMADPTTGFLRLNNATEASVTAIAIDDLTSQTGNPNLSAFVTTWDDSDSSVKGTLKLTKTDDPTVFAIYNILGLTDNSGWTQLSVDYVTGAGSFSNSDELFVSFSRTGDKGAAGAGAGDMLAANNLSDLVDKSASRANLGVAIGSNVQAYNANLSAVAGLAVTNSNFIVGNGSTWVAESGATARTSLGVGTGDSPRFTAVNIGHASDTTLTRVSAGVAAIEGSNILLASGLGSITQGVLAEGAFVDGDKTRLDGIETGADVTDTTNVTAAGALMDSEVDADIKTLSLPSNTTISTFAKSLLDDTTNTAARSTLGLGSLATASTISNSNWSGADLSVANGGTGVSTLTGIVKGNGASAMSAAVQGTDYYAPSGTDVAVADGGTGRSSHTAYGVLCGGTTTTGAQQSIASVGTAGQVLTSNGAGALPTMQDAAGGGWIPIKTVTASSDSAISFADGVSGVVMDDTYSAYVVVASSLTQSFDGAEMRVATSNDSGSSFDAGGTDYNQHGRQQVNGSSPTNVGGGGDAFTTVVAAWGSAAGEAASLRFYLYAPADTSVQTLMEYHSTFINASGVIGRFSGSSKRSAAEAVNGLEFYMNAGNMSGEFTLYGLKGA